MATYKVAPRSSLRGIRHGVAPAIVLFAHEARNVFMSALGYRTILFLTLLVSLACCGLGAAEELSVLDGAHARLAMLESIVAFGTLAATTIGVDVLAGERERGGLLQLLLAPISRGAIVTGKLGAPTAAWVATMMLSIPAVWAFSGADATLGQSEVALVLLGTPVVTGFAAVALALAARYERKRSALTLSLAVFAVAAGPLLFGSKLRHSIAGRVLDAVDPVYAAAHAFRAITIDKQELTAQGSCAATLAAFLALALLFALYCSRRLPR